MTTVTRCVWSLVIVGSAWLSGWGVAANTSDPVQRFLTAPAEPLSSYRALRKISASNKRFKKHGWLTAWTELDPKHGFRYEIVDEGGSEYIRKRVLRKLLEGERDAVTSGEPGKAALTTSNYRFDVVEDNGTVMRLSIVPLRSDGLLVNGTVTAESGTGDLLSIEGRLAKNPSFWTSRVDVTRRYGRIGGIRVPLEVASTAHVKIAGASELSMTFEYESINGRIIGNASRYTGGHAPHLSVVHPPPGDRVDLQRGGR
jgi:hypothetical protein